MNKHNFIPRDISWLSFNARVLQEANDPAVPLKQRIRFLGIFSNNLDEFFRVRVATLKRMTLLGKKNMHLEENPQQILDDIQMIVLKQQSEFNRIWENILQELEMEQIFFVDDTQLNESQQQYVKKFFDEEVRNNIIPLLIESIPQFPYLREKSLYLGVVMKKQDTAYDQKFALIEVPARAVGSRFVLLPSEGEKQYIMLLEDVIRYNLPSIFSYFGYTQFSAHIIKVTKDAEIDLDDDLSTSLIQKIEKGLKNRRKGKTVRLTYDKEMDAGLLEYLIRKLCLSRRDNIIPGGRIHNFRHFMDFPDVFNAKENRRAPILHPLLLEQARVTDVILQKDIMLHFPYHSFNPLIDLLRESAMDPEVVLIKITLYRLAFDSKVINALVNAARNGKDVTVVLELKARFDEEANLEWKERLELEGVKVFIGFHNMKVHAKTCIIRKRAGKKILQYGFISTGNINERTARVYADHCLLTSNRKVMADINRIFDFLEGVKTDFSLLDNCKTLMVCPNNMRSQITHLINKEIKSAKQKKTASIILKVNSLSDHALIGKLYEAAYAGVAIKLIVRGIFCAVIDREKFSNRITAISIVDEYLEHARVMIFYNDGKQKVYISSADWMVRNLDHRVEAAVPMFDKDICNEIQDIINMQLQDNVKARILDKELSNHYVISNESEKISSQLETYKYLNTKTNFSSVTSGK
ncbi:polyphosphate kinase 1 [Chitinophagaceae bacterium LB-8]|uniref:Polyphosphate kinase n=1 Tax=Paraflavisolibacter caeni TaxID=2982496 RepID=A0A9X3BFK6_9BACT|nr:polyphosphate kinase 1 [Paraflavisolibacter caeni]MCU7549084.1 polyphosphate kinase 1 [Paraflavisolibacter caeni]